MICMIRFWIVENSVFFVTTIRITYSESHPLRIVAKKKKSFFLKLGFLFSFYPLPRGGSGYASDVTTGFHCCNFNTTMRNNQNFVVT
jgi:hypothetical protein